MIGLGFSASFLETSSGLGWSLGLASSSLESGLPCFSRVSSDGVMMVASIATVSLRNSGVRLDREQRPGQQQAMADEGGEEPAVHAP